jgi:hypothetical protein
MIEVPGAGHADVITKGSAAILERIVQFLQNAVTERSDHPGVR